MLMNPRPALRLVKSIRTLPAANPLAPFQVPGDVETTEEDDWACDHDEGDDDIDLADEGFSEINDIFPPHRPNRDVLCIA